MDGVVVYSGSINKDPLYKVINFNNGELYAVELHELSGNVMAPAIDRVPGEACVALFALTEDEFFFKDTNPEELERLIQKLYENIPRDRLLSSFYVNITTKEKRECDLWGASKVYTMDGNKYKSYTDQKNNINKVNEVYKSAEGINPAYTILYNSRDEIQPYLAFVKSDYMPQNLEGDILNSNEELIVVFYLSKEEFSWVNSDKNKLNDLVLSMYKFLPKDRIHNIVVNNKETNQNRQCTLNLTCDTMDNKLYEKKVGVELLTAKEKAYIIYCNATGENVPAIGYNGEVRIYAQEDWARRFVTNNDEVGLFYKEITICELKKRIIDWFAEGITKYVFSFVEEKIIDIDLETLFEEDNKKLKKYHGSSLNYLMIRFRQYNTNKKSQGLVSMAQTMFSAFCHELPKTLLLVPVLYDNESQFTANNDLGLHTTINAQKILQDINAKNFVYNHIENKDELETAEERRFVIEKDGKPIYVHMNGEKIIEFLGSDEYDVADKPGGEGCMHFCTVKSPQGELDSLPAFTNLNDLKKIYGNTVHIGLATYDDLINKINDGSALNGIVFNPGGISLFIAKDELVLVEKEMQEKPKIYIPNFNDTDKQRKGNPAKEFEGIYSSELSEKILRIHHESISQKINKIQVENQSAYSNKGLISLVCGLVSIFICTLTSIPGLIYGILSLKETKSKNIRRDGKAVGGIITSAIGTFFLLCFIMTFIFAAIDKKYDEVESYPNTTESQTYTIPKDIQESNEEVINNKTNNDNKKVLESVEEKYKEIPLTEKIDKIYLTYDNDKEPKVPLIHMPGDENASVFITHKESNANTPAWVSIDTKKEALVYFEFAKELGAKSVICLVESESGTRGFTCDIEEVITGYMNNDWSFDEAEKLFNE